MSGFRQGVRERNNALLTHGGVVNRYLRRPVRPPYLKILFTAFVSAGALWALEAPSPRTEAVLGISLLARSIDGDLHGGNFAGAELTGNLRHSLLPRLTGRVGASVQMEAGSSRDFYSEENQALQGARLREVSLEWTPLDTISLRAGVLPQGLLDNSLLFASQTFPALLETAKLGLGPFYVKLTAEQAVPTAGTLEGPSSRPGAMPAFFIERAALGFVPHDDLFAEVHASHFAFQNLPETIAYRSRFAGNTVRGIGAAHSELTYAFQGYELGLTLSGKTSLHLDPRLTGTWLKNAAAPDGRNEGYSLLLELPFQIAADVKVMPWAELFRREADVAPAYYDIRQWGHANRSGYAVGADVSFGGGMTAGAQMITGRVLRANPYQSDVRYFLVFFRSTYEML